jgi:hypothetical protein
MMSYYAALILKDLLIVVNDRMRFNELASEKLEKEKPRLVQINPATWFVPSGDLIFAVGLAAVLKMRFGKNPVDLGTFEEWKPFFQERASGLYHEIARMNLETLKRDRFEYQNFDGLLAGISSDGNLFIISVSNSNDFVPEILTKPFSFLMLNQEPEVLQKVKEIIEKFLILAKTPSEDLIRSFAKAKLPQIIKMVSKSDRYCTANGDVLIICKKGDHEIFSFD